MRILVVDVAADTGGAVTILEQFYRKFISDSENEYYLCISTPTGLVNSANTTVLAFPWVKKSWLHRIWFDHVTANMLIKRYKIEKVFSIQDTLVPNFGRPQELYLHQPLPFCDYKFSFSESKSLWLYQNVIDKLIRSSLKKAQKVYVQSEWMKKVIVESCRLEEKKVCVTPPEVHIQVEKTFDANHWHNSFFYPASSYVYKNHVTILKAAERLKHEGISDFKIIFTINSEELTDKYALLCDRVKDNIVFAGVMPYKTVMETYAENILLFPSYVETYGLPLLEAKMCASPIIASDCPFSHDILDGYARAEFFDAFDYEKLSELIKKALKKDKAE